MQVGELPLSLLLMRRRRRRRRRRMLSEVRRRIRWENSKDSISGDQGSKAGKANGWRSCH
jgi:hypothetical protein